MTTAELDPVRILATIRRDTLMFATQSDSIRSESTPGTPGFKIMSAPMGSQPVMTGGLTDKNKILIRSRAGGIYKSAEFAPTAEGCERAKDYIKRELMKHRLMGRI